MRFALGWLTVQNEDINLSQERIEALIISWSVWNVSRFVLMNEEGFSAFEGLTDTRYSRPLVISFSSFIR